jgi:hypothetical protein
MAAIGIDPVPNTPSVAQAVLEKDLPRVLQGMTLEEKGWLRPDPLTLLVPLEGKLNSGECHKYLLRLHFGYYPEWPPGAQFVNPETGRYSHPDDLEWLPNITDPQNEIAVHANYESKGQLICSSVTLEFYKVRHSVNEQHIWNPSHQNFAATIHAVQRGLSAPFYQGPQKVRAQK